MSGSESTLPEDRGLALTAIREHAKSVLKRARAGDVATLARLRLSLPRLASLDDTAVMATLKLADVQHAVARQRGKSSWAELRRHMQLVDPIHVHAARFLLATKQGDRARALRHLAHHPAIGTSNIHAAAAAHDVNAVQDFLASDPRLATATYGPDHAEPLTYLSQSNLVRDNGELRAASVRCAELLLDAGASPNASIPIDDGGARLPVLYFACVNNNTGLVKLLLERGANPNDGESLYHSAELDHRECMTLLRQFGVELSLPHAMVQNTPLFFIMPHRAGSPLCESSERGMQWLLEHGADPNVRSNVGQANVEAGSTPLHRAAAYGKSARVADVLVTHGADPNSERDDGRTPYALAVRTGNTAVADVLRARGARVDVVTRMDTLLGVCAIGDRAPALAMAAADPSLMHAMSPEDKQALPAAAEEGRESSVQLMIELSWDLAAEGAWGGTALHHAAWRGRVGITRFLLAAGAPVDARDSSFGSSPLAWAAHGSVNGHPGHDADYVAVVGLLLDAGSSRAASVNKWGETPESMSSAAVAEELRRRGFAS